MWTCTNCGRISANGISKCRKCGNPKPKLGFVDGPKGNPRMTSIEDLEKQGKLKHEKKVNRKKISDLPEPEEGKLFTSAFHK